MGTNRTCRSVVWLCLMGALAMSFGWGFRGDYGHEAGAMVPGALVAMGVCLLSGHAEWFRRCAVMGLCGALGWAFGGQMSYGQVTSYTASHSFPDVAYGYGCLFIIGALWGGIGGAILSFAFTKSRSELARFIGPIVAVCGAFFLVWIVFWFRPDWRDACEMFTERKLDDSDWFAATLALIGAGIYRGLVPKGRSACNVILLMAAGWGLGYVLLVRVCGLHMSPTPPGVGVRSDNWGGCVGMFAALLVYLRVQRNRAGWLLAMYGALAGGIGFSVGDFLNKPDKVHWAPFYSREWLRGFDHWKWTEQSFGLIMGLGVALGLLRLLRGNLTFPKDEDPGSRDAARLNDFAVFVLLLPMLWMNLYKNTRNWARSDVRAIPSEAVLGLPAYVWLLSIGGLLSLLALYAIHRHRRGRLVFAPGTPLGKGQVLFLLVLWVAANGVLLQAFPGVKTKGIFFVQASFWLTCIACTWLTLSAMEGPMVWSARPPTAFDDPRWKLGRRHWLLWALSPVLILVLTALTLAMHDQPMPGSSLRFGPHAFHKAGTSEAAGK